MKLCFRHHRKLPGYVSSQVKGANLGHRQNCRRVEAGKNAARPSYRSARWTGLTEGRCQEDAGNRSAAGRTARNEAWRHDAGGQKASVSGDEKTLGGAQKEGILRAASLPSRLVEAVPQFVIKAGFLVSHPVNRRTNRVLHSDLKEGGPFDQNTPATNWLISMA